MEKVDKVYYIKRTIFLGFLFLEKYQFFVNLNYCTAIITIYKNFKHLKGNNHIGYFN